jgi:hypothetical protein
MLLYPASRRVNSGVRHASHNEDSRGSCSETQKANAAVNGTISGGLTTHSTGAELAWISSSTWMLFADTSRPVNSSVRFLLNAMAQNDESVILNYTEAEYGSNAHNA